MADTDATVDQGAEERLESLRALIAAEDDGSLGCDYDDHDGCWYVQSPTHCETVPFLLKQAERSLAAIPLQASCVGLMEELEHASAIGGTATRFRNTARDILRRYAALKAAQEKPHEPV